MSIPRKLDWMKPSCSPYKLLKLIAESTVPLTPVDIIRMAAPLYETNIALGNGVSALYRSGLIARTAYITPTGLALLEMGKVKEKPAKAAKVIAIKQKSTGPGSTRAAAVTKRCPS